MKHLKLFEEFSEKTNENTASYHVEPIDELKLSSVGVRSFLRAMYANADVIQKLGFKTFKDMVAYIKTSDLNDWEDLRAEAGELGIPVAESVTEATEKDAALKAIVFQEEDEGFKAEICLGTFDGRSFKAQWTDKTWG